MSHKIKMVDISGKEITHREAVAIGLIRLKPETLERVRKGEIAKGDPISIAKLAGIMAGKQASSLIPLAHQIPLNVIDVDIMLNEDGIRVEATAKTDYKTGCEVDALVAAGISLITIFDVVKQYEKSEGPNPYPNIKIELWPARKKKEKIA